MAMAMTESGHIVHAQSMIDEVFHLAWGKLPDGYPDAWGLGETPPIGPSLVVTSTITRGGAGVTLDQLPNVGVMKIISVSAGATVYTPTADFILTGRSVDWSPGGTEPAAGTTYTVIYRINTSTITALLSELGRREPTIQSFVTPDDNGDIIVNDASWSVTDTPTRHLYLQFKFDASEAVGSIVHQVAIFVGTTKAVGVASGKKYLLPNEVGDPGKIYMIENLEPFSRFAGKREIFEYVISF